MQGLLVEPRFGKVPVDLAGGAEAPGSRASFRGDAVETETTDGRAEVVHRSASLPPPKALELFFLEHVSDVVLGDQEIRTLLAIELDRFLASNRKDWRQTSIAYRKTYHQDEIKVGNEKSKLLVGSLSFRSELEADTRDATDKEPSIQ